MTYDAAVDTNLLVRYIMRDAPPDQTQATVALIDQSPPRSLYVPAVVITELTWALKWHYQIAREEIANAVSSLLEVASLAIDSTTATAISLYLKAPNSKLDFADCYLAATGKREGMCIVTYDKDIRRSFPDLRILTSQELLSQSSKP